MRSRLWFATGEIRRSAGLWPALDRMQFCQGPVRTDRRSVLPIPWNTSAATHEVIVSPAAVLRNRERMTTIVNQRAGRHGCTGWKPVPHRTDDYNSQ